MLGFNKLFGGKKEVDPVIDFWNWFIKNEKEFRSHFNDRDRSGKFINKLVEKIKPFNPWIKALAGPLDEATYELVITSDGDIALFTKVEELVAAAPVIPGWAVTAHKPGMGLERALISMYGYDFGSSNMRFYPVNDDDHPDDIRIVLTHQDYNEEEAGKFQTGGMIYLENAIGEVKTALLIDGYEVRGEPGPGTETIPVEKLEEYLLWREKEFVEKYNKIPLEEQAPAEEYAVLEANDAEGMPIFATVNMGYKDWEYKAAFPWLMRFDLTFKGDETGLPGKKQMEELQAWEDGLLTALKSPEIIYVGHDTTRGTRTIYLYATSFLEASPKAHDFVESSDQKYPIVFSIRKDKYWQEVAWFFNADENSDGDSDDDKDEQ
jgi:hypothetical protein